MQPRRFFCGTPCCQWVVSLSVGRRSYGSGHALLAPTQRRLSPVQRSLTAKKVLATQAEANALVQRWCSRSTQSTLPPTGSELVLCVAGAQMASTTASDAASLASLVARLAESVCRVRDGPKMAVDRWCADVGAGTVSGESLLFALQQIEVTLAHGYGADRLRDKRAVLEDGHATAATAVSAAEAKELVLTILATRVALEGQMLDMVSALPFQAHVPGATKTATTATMGGGGDGVVVPIAGVDEYATSLPRLLNAVEHLYWCVCAPQRPGEYPIDTPPLHEIALITDVPLAPDRRQWWVSYTRSMVKYALRPVLLSGLERREPSASQAVRHADGEQAVEDLKMTVHTLYGLYASYSALSLSQRVDFALRVVGPYVCRDATFLLRACTVGRGGTAHVAAPHTSAHPQAAKSPSEKASSSAASGASGVKVGSAGGDRHNKVTLVVLAVLVALAYVASLVTPAKDTREPLVKAQHSPQADQTPAEKVEATRTGVSYQKLLSDIKA